MKQETDGNTESDTRQPAKEKPGEYPFTKGVYPEMYRTRLWTMRQYSGFGSAAETNERFHYLLSHGETGLSLAFDLPTQMGLDSDHDLADGEVGRAGVAIDSVHDMERCFKDIPLDQVTTSMTINAPAAILLAMYASVGHRRNVAEEALGGTIQNDILKEYIARGTFIFPPEPSMRLCVDLMEYCAEKMPRWHPISISGYHQREAGCTAAQEIGFTLANGVAYMEAARQRDIDLENLGRQVSFFFAVHSNFLEEISKFRAARRLWARLMKERMGIQDDRACMMKFHTQTGGSTLTAQQPENNVVRVALQAMAAILGGTQSLHTNSKDEALGLPTQEAVRLALRTQQIIAHETGVIDTPDPLAGADFIEETTDRLEAEAESLIAEVDRRGGAMQAIRDGYFQQEIHQRAYCYQKAVENQETRVVGVNCFQEDESGTLQIQKIDESAGAEQVERVKKLQNSRSNEEASRRLSALREAAKGADNLVPMIRSCVDAEATLGEICDALADIFGKHQA